MKYGLLVALALALMAQTPNVPFADISKQAGIQFVHNNGAAGKKYLPETLGSGVVFLDINNDGLQDLLFVNGKDWQPSGRKTTSRLYRNVDGRTLPDVTAKAGLDVLMYGMGAAADYDNDGNVDIYMTAIDGDRLFHNVGNGVFKDVTQAAGISNTSFGTSAAWLDYDNDGKLDLFVANYVQWSPETDIRCSSTVEPSRTAHRNPTKACPRSFIGIKAMEFSRTQRGTQACLIRRQSPWASPYST